MGALGEWMIITVLATFTVVGCWLLIPPTWWLLDQITRRCAKGLSYFFMYLAMAGDRADDTITDKARKVVGHDA